jgi:hypothetical protein
MSLVDRLFSIRNNLCSSIQALGGKCFCTTDGTTIAICLEDLKLMEGELAYLTRPSSSSLKKEEVEEEREGKERKRSRSRSQSRSPHRRRWGIFIRYMHDGLGIDEIVYNPARLEKDIEPEKARLNDIFKAYGAVDEYETQIWEGTDTGYKHKVPFGKVFFKSDQARRDALKDARHIEDKYRLRIMINKPPPKK